MFGLKFMLMVEEIERLKILEQQLGSARLKGKKECIRCGFCCNKRTCVPSPKELYKIAEFLRLSAKDCINKYFAIAETVGVYFVKPLGENIKDLGGKYIPDRRTYNEGACIFLEKNNGVYSCKIYSVRPTSARIGNCWDDIEKEIGSSSWQGDILEKEFGIIVNEEEEEE